MITIKGYVRSVDVEKLVAPLADSPEADWYDGARSVMAITYIEMCSYEKKLTSGSIAITPVELSSDVFGAGCSEEAFKYEGMLVTITDAQVQRCPNALVESQYEHDFRSGIYCKYNIETAKYTTKVHDKYYAMWVKTVGATKYPLQVDNHAVDLMSSLKTSDLPTWQLTGVISFGEGAFEIFPRTLGDAAGAEEIPAENVLEVPFTSIHQCSVKYGNADTPSLGGFAKGITWPEVMGVETSSSNAPGVKGTGGKPVGNVPNVGQGAPWEGGDLFSQWKEGSCPPYPHLDYVDDNGLKDHYYCQCFPPNFYDNGYGRVTVKTTGIITYVSKGGAGAFYISAPDCSVGYFAYRGGGDILSIGDEVTMNAKLASYYGSSQFSEMSSMTKSAGTACPATDITDLSPFVYETFCNSGACKLTFRPVVLKDVTVRMYPAGHYERAGYGGSGRQRDPLQGHSCYVDSGAGDGTEIKVYGFCYFLAEDSAGNQMNVYAPACMFDGNCVGYEGRSVKDGDIVSLAGHINLRRGSEMQIDPYCYGDYPEGGYNNGRHYDVSKCAYKHGGYYYLDTEASTQPIMSWSAATPPSPPPATPPAATDDDGDGGLSDAIAAATNDIGAVIGGAVGGGLGGTLLLIGICFGICYMRKKPAAAPQAQAKAVEVTQASKVPGTA